MHGPREVLNELKWREGYDLSHAEVWYIHRGAPNDSRIVRGDTILALEGAAMQVTSRGEGAVGGAATIPYHRVYRIDYDGRPVWERRGKPDDEADGD